MDYFPEANPRTHQPGTVLRCTDGMAVGLWGAGRETILSFGKPPPEVNAVAVTSRDSVGRRPRDRRGWRGCVAGGYRSSATANRVQNARVSAAPVDALIREFRTLFRDPKKITQGNSHNNIRNLFERKLIFIHSIIPCRLSCLFDIIIIFFFFLHDILKKTFRLIAVYLREPIKLLFIKPVFK